MMSLEAHKSAPKWVESWCKLHQDCGAKIHTERYLSKYQKEGLVLAKEQGGPSLKSTINHGSRDKATDETT